MRGHAGSRGDLNHKKSAGKGYARPGCAIWKSAIRRPSATCEMMRCCVVPSGRRRGARETPRGASQQQHVPGLRSTACRPPLPPSWRHPWTSRFRCHERPRTNKRLSRTRKRRRQPRTMIIHRRSTARHKHTRWLALTHHYRSPPIRLRRTSSQIPQLSPFRARVCL